MRDVQSASSAAEEESIPEESIPEESTPIDSVLAQLAHAPERLAPGKLGPQPGERLGPYEVKELLGHGGMGLVYRAWDTRLQRMVALKLLRVRDDTLQQRLLHEARAAAAVRHPGIGTLYSVEEVEGWAFLTLELVEGESLHQLLRRRRLTVPEATRLARRMAEVLSAAHAAGVVHGDLKPGNVMVQPDGRVTLLDFGLAHFIRPSPAEARPADWHPTGGTPLYMAPEQEARGRVGPAADIFSFGLVLLQMLLGRLPEGWRKRPWGEHVLTARTRGQLAEAGVPHALVQVLTGCLWAAPEARYPSGGEVLAALGEEPASGAPGGLVLGVLGLGLLLAAAGGALWWWGSPPPAPESLPPLSSRRLTTLTADEWHMDLALNPGAGLFAYVERGGGVALQRVDEAEPFKRLRAPVGLRARLISWDGPNSALVTLLDEGGSSSVWRVTGPGFSWERVLDEGSSAVVSASGGWRAWLRRGEVWVSRADGTGARRLAARGEVGPAVPALRFSPDSTHLAFFRWDERFGRHALVVVPVDGGPEREVLRDWRLGRPGGQGDLVWLRGRLLVSMTEEPPREAGSNVWEAPLSESGVLEGPLQQRTFWNGQEVMHMTASEQDGQLLVNLGSIQYRTFIAPLEQGPALGAARMLTHSQRSERLSGWSAGGERLWVTANHQGGFILVGYRMDGGLSDKREALPDWLTYGQASPEGGLLFWQVSSTEGDMRTRLLHQPEGAQPPRTLLQLPEQTARSPQAPLPLTSSVRCAPLANPRTATAACVLAHSDGKSATFHSLDMDQGLGPPLFRLEDGRQVLPHQWDLSPDGRLLASRGPSPQSPGEVRTLDGQLVARTIRAEGCTGPQSLAWAPEGGGLFFTAECSAPTRYALYHQEPGGRVTELFSSPATYLRYVAPSPRGDHLAWSALQVDNDAWLLELNSP